MLDDGNKDDNNSNNDVNMDIEEAHDWFIF